MQNDRVYVAGLAQRNGYRDRLPNRVQRITCGVTIKSHFLNFKPITETIDIQRLEDDPFPLSSEGIDECDGRPALAIWARADVFTAGICSSALSILPPSGLVFAG